MKKHKKRVISALLALAMMCGMNVPMYAEETASQETQTAENDAHYTEAIGLLTYLNIFAGYEDGSMKPDSKITRAEMAAIILRMMKIDSFSTYQEGFADVDVDHWAADVIQTAYENEIISGMGDGTFAPDDSVTYEQAVKMIVCAINCGQRAQDSGGYPQGYLSEADRKEVNKYAEGVIGEEVTRQTVAKLVYNAMLADYPVLKSSEIKYGSVVNEYEETEGITLLSEKFDIYCIDGIIMATPQKSIDLSTKLEDNQILVEDKVMYSELTNANDLVSLYCKIFYSDPEGEYDNVTAVYAVPYESKNDSITIPADDIESIVTGYEGGTVGIKYYKDGSRLTNLKIEEKPVIVYNDNPFTMANYSKLAPVDENGDLILFDDFVTPDCGSIKVVDYNDNGKYDIIFVENYETSVVNMATVSRLQLEYPISVGDLIVLDTSKDDSLNITVTKDGEESSLRNLVAGDVVSIKMNANFGDKTYTGDKFISIEASSEYIEGKLGGVSGNDNRFTVTIDGEKYECVDNEALINDLKNNIGAETKFYTDKFGRIANLEAKAVGGLSGSEKYGWVISVYADDSGDEGEVQMYTQDAEFKTFEMASKVDFWGSADTDNESRKELEVVEFINNNTNGFVECNTVEKNGDVKDSVEIRLCKYKLNANNEITRLYLAVDEENVSENSGAVRLDTKDYRNGKKTSSMFAGKYLIKESVAQFTVPESDRNDTSTYKYRFAPATEFNKTGDSTVGYNCFFADVTDYTPGIAIRLTGGSNEAASVDDYETGDDNTVFVITDISAGIDEDDNEIYVIEGICDGEEVSYSTTASTVVAHVNPAVRKDKFNYDTTVIWQESSETSLTDVLHIGDICGVEGSASEASVILQMVDATALADHLVNEEGALGTVPSTQFRKDEQFSASRDRVIFGQVTDTRTSPMVQFDIAVDNSTSADDDGEITEDGSRSITIGMEDYSKVVTVVYISKKGKVYVEEELRDIYEVQPNDYVFIRRFKDDVQKEIYVVRYE